MHGHGQRYAAMVADLARRAVDAAEDRTPHAAREGEAVVSCTAFLPVARALLDAARLDARVDHDPIRTRFTDGIGHSREVYGHLVSKLARDAGGTTPPLAAPDRADDVAAGLWRAVSRRSDASADELRIAVDTALADGNAAGSLQPQTPDDSPDHWTFRELAGLHALDVLAESFHHEPWRRRVREIATFHQHHTQPDYTTYQPWALAVFARDPATTMFAEQQLHDVETHLSLHGGGGAVIPALLLTDAAVTLGACGG